MTIAPESVRRRYNDRDVRADNQRLRRIAAEYLLQYDGGFHVLLQARHIIRQGHWLEDEQVRVVLNCMITDATVFNMPEPIGHTLRFDAMDYDTPVDEPLVEDIKKLPGPGPMVAECRAQINPARPYWWSTQTNAYLLHVAVGVKVLYHTDRWYDYKIKNDTWWSIKDDYHLRFQVRPRFLCKELMSIPKKSRAAGPDEIEGLIKSGKRWCRICEHEWYSKTDEPLPATSGPPSA